MISTAVLFTLVPAGDVIVRALDIIGSEECTAAAGRIRRFLGHAKSQGRQIGLLNMVLGVWRWLLKFAAYHLPIAWLSACFILVLMLSMFVSLSEDSPGTLRSRVGVLAKETKATSKSSIGETKTAVQNPLSKSMRGHST
jgi:hypothetical protein